MLLYLLGFKEELNFAYYFGKYSAQVLTSSSMEISLLFYHFFKKTSLQIGSMKRFGCRSLTNLILLLLRFSSSVEKEKIGTVVSP